MVVSSHGSNSKQKSVAMLKLYVSSMLLKCFLNAHTSTHQRTCTGLTWQAKTYYNWDVVSGAYPTYTQTERKYDTDSQAMGVGLISQDTCRPPPNADTPISLGEHETNCNCGILHNCALICTNTNLPASKRTYELVFRLNFGSGKR
mmetsp:Transcript_108602/g.187840  ORF Transcript_108602/g.187840 Transcript_108602/m.187840 type:complete len:146 (+) Transcript_108602:1460-1897(+)